ncbi:MAG: 30S ribosomal protein S9, partial [Marinifilaceae bacterium]|nr:30S ribosomal protein S9 [Marinifilaceae bacterium]
METVNAVGRRKTAVARVYLSEGKGNITVNKKSLEEYFPLATLQYVVKQPLELLGVMGQYDIKVNVAGGGFNGQAEALRLGIARALVKVNAEDKTKLRAAGFMTRDSREVERK